MIKLSAEDSKRVSAVLGRLDKVAETIQTNFEEWGMPFEQAKEMVNQIDSAADAVETMTFGEQSLHTRQAEVIQREADEPYMATFEKGTVLQSDADEPYMSAYGDDDSSDVRHGQSTTGRPLVP